MAEKAAEFREKGGEIYLSEDGSVREAIIIWAASGYCQGRFLARIFIR